METLRINIKGVKTLVTITKQLGGESLATILCLHGWGTTQSHAAFTEICSALASDPITIIAPDLPGFGGSEEPPVAWSVDDYADCAEEIMKNTAMEQYSNGAIQQWSNTAMSSRIFLLGHSFGGRIAIKLAARGFPMDHLFLCASAGVRRKWNPRRELGYTLSKLRGVIPSFPGRSAIEAFSRKLLSRVLQAHDYTDASPRMKETMIKVINEDLTPLLGQIHVPTDIFWGENDRMTPLSEGKVLNKKIVQSVMHVFEGVGHRVHRERAAEIAEVVRGCME